MNSIRISEAESRVMRYLWEGGAATASDVVDALAEANDWTEATVKTLLNRLKTKGALTVRADGRRYVYTPRLAREDWLLDESTDLVDRLFDGRLAPLVSHFSSHGRLSDSDLAELRALIERLGDGR
jgi:predicted transcriptional regulator